MALLALLLEAGSETMQRRRLLQQPTPLRPPPSCVSMNRDRKMKGGVRFINVGTSYTIDRSVRMHAIDRPNY
jgi:hypothetical protein